MLRKRLLPRLAFGEKQSLVHDNFKETRELLHSFVPSIKELHSIVPDNKFLSKSTEVNINGLIISAISATPMYMEQYNTKEELYLFIPIFGGSKIIASGKKLEAIALKRAIFHSFMTEGEENDKSSFLMFYLDKKRLISTAKAMLGRNDTRNIKFDFNIPKELSMVYGNISFIKIILELCQIIDNYNCDEELLSNLNMDDIFYRNIVTMLEPEIFLKNEQVSHHSNKGLQLILDFIEDFPNENITLSDLENISGLSSRTLQYQFKKELKMSPMKFIKTYKLQQIKSLLEDSNCTLNINQVAYKFGYTNSSLFAKNFKEEFGILPSEILK